MAFSQYTIPGTPLNHWTDRANAIGWMTQAVAKTSDASFDAIEKLPYAQQLEAVRSAFAAVGNFYKAMNLPPQADPIYVMAWSKWFGHVQPVDGNLSIHQLIGQSLAGGQNGGNPPNAVDEKGASIAGDRFIFYQWIAYNWAKLGKAPLDSQTGICNIVMRLLLNTTGDVISDCASAPGTPGQLCGFEPGTLYVGCTQDGSAVEGCSTYNWNTFYWHDPPVIGNPGFGCRISRALPPLRWFLMFLRDVVSQINARDGLIDRTLLESFVFAMQFNTSQAVKYHLVDPNTPQTQQLMHAAVNVPVDVHDSVAAQQNIARASTGAAFGIAAGIVTAAAGPLYGAIVGVVGAIATAIAGALPYAVGNETDAFGRSEPVFQPTSLHVNGAGVPDFTVPDAPAFSIGAFTLIPGGPTLDLSSIRRITPATKVSTFAIAGAIGYGLLKMLALKP